MFRYEVQSRLEELAGQPDSWFRLRATGPDGAFEATDAAGATATIDVREHWVEVSAPRPVGGILIGGGQSTLLRIAPGGDGHGGLRVAARLYLDGFSVQALFAAVRDVLALAGGGAAEDRLAGMPAGVTLTDVIGPDVEAVELDTDAPAPNPATAPSEDQSVEVVPISDESSGSAEPDSQPDQPDGVFNLADTLDARTVRDDARDLADERGAPELPVAPAQRPSDEERRVPSTIESARPGSARAPEAVAAGVANACRRCGATVQPGERFCMNCGAPQSPVASGSPEQTSASESSPTPAPFALQRRQVPDTVVWRRPPPGLVVCPRCAEANHPENVNCQRCGTDLTPTSGDAPQAEAGTTTCSRCGYANAPDNRFCQGCGAPLA